MKNDNFDKDWHHSNVPALKALLEKQETGPVFADRHKFKRLLAACWHQFEGCAETEMHAGKLDRIEDATWQPPYLEFLIERHGAVVLDSKWASIHRWRLNLETLAAEVNEEGSRLIAPKDKDLDTKALAESLANAILSGQPDERFKILPDGSVRLNIAVIIPETNKKTTEGRRKRLRRDLSVLLEPHGWRKTRPNVYSKEKPTP
jgi:hypothetical protein